MDRLALTGLTLAMAGAIGLLSVELIGTAYAGRPGDKAYLVAVSGGTTLHLAARGRDAQRTTMMPLASVDAAMARRLSCARVVEVTAVSLGFRCRED